MLWETKHRYSSYSLSTHQKNTDNKQGTVSSGKKPTRLPPGFTGVSPLEFHLELAGSSTLRKRRELKTSPAAFLGNVREIHSGEFLRSWLEKWTRIEWRCDFFLLNMGIFQPALLIYERVYKEWEVLALTQKFGGRLVIWWYPSLPVIPA